jgi:formate hydrogenlyase subunit 6/NADH:ubiquinone oxidoreductase subunit I
MAFNQMGGKVLLNLFSKPATLRYPFQKRVPFAKSRGKIGIEIQTCIFCGICAKRCPADAITVTKETKTWAIEPGRCVSCGVCVEVCPKKCLNQANQFFDVYTQKKSESYSQNA